MTVSGSGCAFQGSLQACRQDIHGGEVLPTRLQKWTVVGKYISGHASAEKRTYDLPLELEGLTGDNAVYRHVAPARGVVVFGGNSNG
ncbi:MAG: hypothetical protein P8Z69_06300 [Acidihalobacter sp.]|jgi:hypothetical protein